MLFTKCCLQSPKRKSNKTQIAIPCLPAYQNVFIGPLLDLLHISYAYTNPRIWFEVILSKGWANKGFVAQLHAERDIIHLILCDCKWYFLLSVVYKVQNVPKRPFFACETIWKHKVVPAREWLNYTSYILLCQYPKSNQSPYERLGWTNNQKPYSLTQPFNIDPVLRNPVMAYVYILLRWTNLYYKSRKTSVCVCVFELLRGYRWSYIKTQFRARCLFP